MSCQSTLSRHELFRAPIDGKFDVDDQHLTVAFYLCERQLWAVLSFNCRLTTLQLSQQPLFEPRTTENRCVRRRLKRDGRMRKWLFGR